MKTKKSGNEVKGVEKLLSDYFSREIGITNYSFLASQSPIVEVQVGYEKYFRAEDGTIRRTLEVTVQGIIQLKQADSFSKEVLGEKLMSIDGLSSKMVSKWPNEITHHPAKDEEDCDELKIKIRGTARELLSIAQKIDRYLPLWAES